MIYKKVRTVSDIKADPRIESIQMNYDGRGVHCLTAVDGWRFTTNNSTTEIGSVSELCYEINEHLEPTNP